MEQRAVSSGTAKLIAPPKIVEVHVKLPEDMKNRLKAILSIEGSNLQAFFTAKAQEKVAANRQES